MSARSFMVEHSKETDIADLVRQSGLALVRRKPTSDMLLAGAAAGGVTPGVAYAVYCEMLAIGEAELGIGPGS